jgi:hypothetical protein
VIGIVIKKLAIRTASSVAKYCTTGGQKWLSTVTLYNIISAKYTFDERPSVFIRDKSTFSSERMLHKNYYRKRSVGRTFLVIDLKGTDAKK